MSILRNSTYQAQPWWNNEKATWYNPPPKQLLYRNEDFGRREWGYNSTGVDWPPSRFIVGKGSVYDFSSVPCLATLTGSFTSPITITISATIPKWTANIVLDSRSWAVTANMPVWTPSINVLAGEVISVSGAIPKWTAVLEALGGHISSFERNLPKWTMAARILTGEMVDVSGTFPSWAMSASVLAGEMIEVAGSLPRWLSSVTLSPDVGPFVILGQVPKWTGLLRLRETVGVYGAIVMNINNFAVTEYAQYPISSLGYMNGHYFGTSSDGIYILEGKDDNGIDVAAEIETPPIDFWMGYPKRLRQAWITFRSDGRVNILIRLDEQDTYEEEVSYLNDQIREERVKFAKGLKNRFAAIGFKNVRGSSFDLDSIRIMVDPIRGKRR